jgi:hypothetical protein
MDTNVETNNQVPQKVKRPTVVTAAAIILIILSLFVAGLGVANQFGLLGGRFGNRAFTPGQFRNRFPQSGGAGSNGFPSGGFSNGQNNGGNVPEFNPNGQGVGGTTPTFTPNRTGVASLARLLRTLRPVILALDIILLVLSVVAAIGLFMNKRWGSIMAIVISALVILLTIPNMIRIFSTISLAENLFRILMAVAVIVLLLLPSARKTSMVSRTAGEEEVERVVR